jgi:hypothetical protein
MVMVEATSGMLAVMGTPASVMAERMTAGGVDVIQAAVPSVMIEMVGDVVVARRTAMAGGAVVWPMARCVPWRTCLLPRRSRRERSWRAQVGLEPVQMMIP